MEDFSNLLSVRRSHRQFTDEPVGEEALTAILRAGLIAPSSKGLHGYEFVVVTDRAKIEALSHCKALGAEFVKDAPLVIVVLGLPEVSDVWIEDASVASTLMLLEAEDLGLGGCWVQVRQRKDKVGRSAEDNTRRVLNIPSEKRVLNLLAFGHKGMERRPQNEERLRWDKVHTDKW